MPEINGIFQLPFGAAPTALQRLAALAEIHRLQERLANYSDSDSDFSDSEDSFDSIYCSHNMPFHMRQASTPDSIGGEEMVAAADEAMKEALAERSMKRQ